MPKSLKKKVVLPDRVLEKIKPGMSIFIGTGMSEPRTLTKHLLTSTASNLRDLELIQLISFGDAVTMEERYPKKYRLKTFYSGWVASKAVTAGRVDLIPCNFSRIPRLISSGAIKIDVAFVQITPPDEAGYASLGVAIDTARGAMEQASLIVGEINENVPRTMGDTYVHVDDFDYLVQATEPLITFDRWPLDPVIDRVAANVAALIDDGSCLAFATGHLFEALGKHLQHKRDLGIQSPFFTDPLMDLVKCGAITNRNKNFFKGKSLVSYALGTPELMGWLHQNPLVEFQGIDVVGNPKNIGLNDKFVAVLPTRKVDLTGRIAMHVGRSNVAYGMGETLEVFSGVQLSPGGRTICALTSRNLQGESNVRASIEEFPNQITSREVLDMVVTEYGMVSLVGRTVRERALALIDISHPDDRAELVQKAKDANLLFPDQIYLSDAGRCYPKELATSHTFKDNTTLRFRAIKPSDEDGMRKLFYRFSDESVYYRYFSPIKTMPHAEMQEYVNIDYSNTMSIIGLLGAEGDGKIVAEARYVRNRNRPYADVAFIVDEAFQGKGVASFMYEMLIQIARRHGIEGFTADVLGTNRKMLRVFEKPGFPIESVLVDGVYELTIPFTRLDESTGTHGKTKTRILRAAERKAS
ncbi:MAG: GNAT family N-acetyltransferase [Deltaproteobacteria bacterium]|nr:GNAT family N-acetyltransferase [Deltaproteobacteria bacterium]